MSLFGKRREADLIFCPYVVTPDNLVAVNKERNIYGEVELKVTDIPGGRGCVLIEGDRHIPMSACSFRFNPEDCNLRNYNDFCQVEGISSETCQPLW